MTIDTSRIDRIELRQQLAALDKEGREAIDRHDEYLADLDKRIAALGADEVENFQDIHVCDASGLAILPGDEVLENNDSPTAECVLRALVLPTRQIGKD